MPKGWTKGLRKETDVRVMRISRTMKNRGIDNFKRWRDEAKRTGLIKSNYPELSKDGDLAELIGVVLGDGNITSFPRCECLRITGDAAKPEFVYRSVELVRKVFNKESTVAKVKASNAMTVTIYEKYISDRLGIPCGSRAKLQYLLPDWIQNERTYRIRFLRGLYEAEGSLCHHEPTSTHKLFFANNNPHLRALVSGLVTDLGFRTNVSGNKVQVSRKQEVQDLVNLLEFRHYNS